MPDPVRVAYSIGPVTFDKPLECLTPATHNTMGSDTQTMSGDLVMLRVKNPSQKHDIRKYRYGWEKLATVQALQALANGGPYTNSNLTGIQGQTCTVMLSEEGLSTPKHISGEPVTDEWIVALDYRTRLDKYEGEISLVVITE